MAEPVRSKRPTWVLAVVLPGVLVLAAGILGACGAGADDATAPLGSEHGTVPIALDAAKVERIARAFGVQGTPHHTAEGWEAEDALRALYLARTQSAWYAQFTNSSPLLHPVGDRTTICAASPPPEGCSVPTVRFVVDVGEPAPTAGDAIRAARSVLERAGLIDRRWRHLTTGPSPEPVPCRTGVAPTLDCTRQVLSTQAVTLSRELGPTRTALRWGIIVGPGGEILSATGRIGRPDTG
jgi:hypothetical protein